VNPQPGHKIALSTIEKVMKLLMEFLRRQTFGTSSPPVQRAGCVLRRVEIGDTGMHVVPHVPLYAHAQLARRPETTVRSSKPLERS
jgi:hypothetical protein